MKSAAYRFARSTRAALAAAFLLVAATAAAPAGDPPRLMVFDTEFVDLMMSGTGETFTTAEDVSRAKEISSAFRKQMAGRYQIVTPKTDIPYDLTCPECILKIARAQKASLVLTSALSRLNSNNVILKYELDDVASEKALKTGSIRLNGYTARQIRMATDTAVKDLNTESAAKE